jgi:hypothetical protein
MIPHTLFVRALRARHNDSARQALAASEFRAAIWMMLDRHHIDAATIPADVVATIVSECGLSEPTVRAYLRLPPCNVDGQPQPMEPLAWDAAITSASPDA